MNKIEFAPVYFNSRTKTVINHRFRLESSFQEILYMIDFWINNGPGWNVESIESLCIDILTYRPSSGSFYTDLLVELRKGKGKKRTNKHQKQRSRCHVRHINPSKEHPKRIFKTDNKIVKKLYHDEIEFPVQEKDFNKIEVKNNICINGFGYENKLVFPIYVSDQKFEAPMDLLLLDDDYKSNYVYIKDFDKFMFHKTKKTTKKEKNGFVKVFYSALVMKVLTELKEDCLSINGKQSVKLEKEIIEFEIYLKKIPVPVKIYADF